VGIRLSGHGSYHHQFHIVWIPKYRRKILKGELKEFVAERMHRIEEYHPDVEIERFSIQADHVHLVIIIPPKYSVSDIVGKIKANTSTEVRKQFQWVKKLYWRNEFWSPGFFSSTIGINEEVIKRYVEFQEKIDKASYRCSSVLGFSAFSATGLSPWVSMCAWHG
jgi:putative transposase